MASSENHHPDQTHDCRERTPVNVFLDASNEPLSTTASTVVKSSDESDKLDSKNTVASLAESEASDSDSDSDASDLDLALSNQWRSLFGDPDVRSAVHLCGQMEL